MLQLNTLIDRNDLPKLCIEDGIGVELGVASGGYSNHILNNSKLKTLYSIDAWADHHNSKEYVGCIKKLSKHGNRSVVLRMFFDDAIKHFSDNFFDFIYIDAYAHLGQQDGKILNDWYPKLKSGGIFAGHDYCHPWEKTIKAVDLFFNKINKKPTIIPGVPTIEGTKKTGNQYASWACIKT